MLDEGEARIGKWKEMYKGLDGPHLRRCLESEWFSVF